VTRNSLRAIAVIVAAFMGATTAAAVRNDGQPANPASQTPLATFRSGVEVVTVSASVRDRRGRVVKDLKRADFEVLEDGAKRDIRDFYPGDAAISLAILLDISGSMAVSGNIDRARQAVKLAVGHLQNGRDEAALFTFDSELQEVRPFTSDVSRLTSLTLAGTPWGKTSLYDAIDLTAKKLSERANRHRAIMVVTDGVDTGSRMAPSEVSSAAAAIDVPVYLVIVASPVDNPAHKLTLMVDGASAQTATLADLSRWTGGDMAVVSESEDSVAALQVLMSELRHQYLLTFEPGTRPGWHPLEIRTPRKKNLIVRARGGYMAGPGRSGS
jgi:Ca-activated chloride channel homolog